MFALAGQPGPHAPVVAPSLAPPDGTIGSRRARQVESALFSLPPPMSGFTSTICGICGTPGAAAAESCSACGAELAVGVVDGVITEFPAGMVPCAECRSAASPVRFRGWSFLFSFLLWVREERRAGYVCHECGRREATKALFITALLGWLAVSSWFFYGWRSTFHNWRAVWAPPLNAALWGAVPAGEFAANLHGNFEDAYEEAFEEVVIEGSPLRFLSRDEQSRVLEAGSLYEILGVQGSASADEVRQAYRQRSKEAHPDLRQTPETEPGAEMTHLNQAWEILRSDKLRAAYDWVEANRSGIA